MSRAAALAVALALLGCGPLGPIPGGRLSGEVASGAPDLSLLADEETLQLETRPDDPYSVNVWCVADGDRLWVAAGGGADATWAQNALADPRVRVRVGEKLYERKAARTDDAAEIEAVLALYKAKYDYEPDPEDRGKAVLFRLDAR